jgi:hypothetical protein
MVEERVELNDQSMRFLFESGDGCGEGSHGFFDGIDGLGDILFGKGVCYFYCFFIRSWDVLFIVTVLLDDGKRPLLERRNHR